MTEVETMLTEWPDEPGMYFGIPTNANISYCCVGPGCSWCLPIKAMFAKHAANRTLQAAMLFFVGVAAVAEEIADEHEGVR